MRERERIRHIPPFLVQGIYKGKYFFMPVNVSKVKLCIKTCRTGCPAKVLFVFTFAYNSVLQFVDIKAVKCCVFMQTQFCRQIMSTPFQMLPRSQITTNLLNAVMTENKKIYMIQLSNSNKCFVKQFPETHQPHDQSEMSIINEHGIKRIIH